MGTELPVADVDTNAIQVDLVTAAIGAVVTGIDMGRSQSAETRQALHRLLHEHGVLFFPDQSIAPDEHKQFARTFGELYRFPNEHGWADPEILVLDSDAKAGGRTTSWHTDATFDPRPPIASVLRPVQLPSLGGDTLWASMYAAYESLASRMQRILDGLDAVHSNIGAPKSDTMTGEVLSTVHPIVITDPISGRRALFVNSNYTQCIVGMSDRESTTILQLLFEHVQSPAFHVRLRWQPGTVAFWAEHVTQHYAVADISGRRIVHRVSICGDAPARQ